MKKSLVMVLLTLGLLLTISSSALADDENYDELIIEDINIISNDDSIMPLRYTLINSIGSDLVLKSNNMANCAGNVSTLNVVYKIEITMTLQKFSGGDWIDWAEWSDCAYNTNDFTITRDAPYTSGSYRVYIETTVTAYDGRTETQTLTGSPRP